MRQQYPDGPGSHSSSTPLVLHLDRDERARWGRKQTERGLLSIKCCYPERQLRFITVNRLDGNWGFVISRRNGSVAQSVDGPAVPMTASHQRRTLEPKGFHWVPVGLLQRDNKKKKAHQKYVRCKTSFQTKSIEKQLPATDPNYSPSSFPGNKRTFKS